MKKIVLLTPLSIPCIDNPAQSARNYAGAVVDVDDNFADKAIKLGEAKLFEEPEVETAVADTATASDTAAPAAIKIPEPTAAPPSEPTRFRTSRADPAEGVDRV